MARPKQTKRGGKKPPSSSQDDTSSAGPSNPEPNSQPISKSRLISMKSMDDASSDPIIGTGVIGVLNSSDVPNGDLFIEKNVGEDGKNKIFRASSESRNNAKSVRVCLFDEIVATDCCRSVCNFGLLDELNFSWFMDTDILMFNVHLNKDSILENMESMEKTEAATHQVVSFFIQLVADLHPHIEQQIKKHSWIHHDCSSPKEDNFDSLYQTLRSARATPPSYNLRLDSLACTLRGYQKDAVDFLIHREIEPAVNVGLVHESIEIVHGVFYFPSFGRFVKDVSKPTVNVVGGILAEEMGLGKTVELLGLILSHQSEDDTKELRRTRKSTNANDDLIGDRMDDAFIVKDLLGEIVSKVSAFTDGRTALKSMKVAKEMKPQQRTDNAYTLVSSIAGEGDVCCAECGEAWSAKKVHWLPEHEQQNLAFKCPICTAEGPNVPVSATLIVVPKSIAQQWYEEIRKHVKEDVKIDLYLGISASGYKNPHYFSQFHIVLTTYDVVEKEFLHDPNHKDTYWERQPRARSKKRPFYWGKNVVSPLPSIDWWRVCLDEWQMVNNGQAGEIFFQLQARAKWCITGTPLVKSFNDFQPMLRFLGVRPFDDSSFWKETIYGLYRQDSNLVHLVGLMAQLFWRNSKKDVANQLRIPPKQEVVTYVQLSPIEMEYYKLKLNETRNSLAASLLLARFADDERQLSQIAPDDLQSLMNSLNSIRWSLVTGEGYLKQETEKGGAKKLTGHTPPDVFKSVADKTRSVFADKTRNLIRKLNEMATRKMYSKNYSEALDCYGKVLCTVIEYETKVEAVGIADFVLAAPLDLKHRIHAITNLLKLAPMFPSKIMAADIVAYKHQLINLEECYNNSKVIARMADNLMVAMENHKKNDDSFKKILQRVQTMVEGLAVEELETTKLADFARMRCAQKSNDFYFGLNLCLCRPNLEKCKSKEVLREELERTYKERQALFNQFLEYFLPSTKIAFNTSAKVFKEILDCKHNDVLETNRLRTDMVELYITNDCPLCEMKRSLLDLEANLSIVKIEKNMETRTEGTRRSMEIRMGIPLEKDPFYMAVNSVLAKRGGATKKASLKKFNEYMGSLRTCILLVNNIAESIQEAATKSRAMGIKVPVFDAHNSIRNARSLLICESELKKCELEMRAVHTKISYIQTLMTTDNETQECPVCYSEFGDLWQMLPCLHKMCCMCYSHFIKIPDVAIKCVVCRAPFETADVEEVTRNKPSIVPDEPPEQYTIKGLNLTFKIAAVMRNVVSVLNDDPTNKIIVFSAMDSALKMLSHIMSAVDVQHVHFNSRNCDLEGLAVFKENFDVKVLLLPLSFGANGLNLVEANHIFFLEPIPNASVFQQARGRVFRMGQNRATTIHHLITKDTIEETIHAISTDANETGLTVGAFKKIIGV